MILISHEIKERFIDFQRDNTVTFRSMVVVQVSRMCKYQLFKMKDYLKVKTNPM